ncbi:MAG: endopeptidase La, partial [Acidimicrobiia bacterium]|nr:endopeptidase La [Acidimicrobiia bacterium]
LMIRATGRALVGDGVVGPGTTAAEAAPALWVRAEPLAEAAPTERAIELARELRATFRALLERNGGRAFSEVLRGTEGPGALADLAGWWPDLSHERKIEVLEAVDVEGRVELVLGWATEALAEVQLTDRIRTDVSEGMEKSQREFLLRRQLEAIRTELGEDADDADAVEGYRARLAELRDAGAAEVVLGAIDKELRRLARTPEQAVEHGWIRQWLDTAFEVPWATRSDDDLDVGATREVLDADHTGLDEVKERIVEFLAVRRLRASRLGFGVGAPAGEHLAVPAPAGRRTGGAILALVGPPGVGKTSLGESVARALGREFVRVSLGGVRDEAEIRGHRRTYVGAQPGRIVRALTEAGTMNPVILLDELDKAGSDWRGDPSSALLEVLDPAQNHTFRDHYLEVDLDLSDVLFLVTANQADQIPGPLYDRLEVIGLDGYTEDEKVAIARDHLVGRQVAANGLRPDEVDVRDGALRRIVAEHTREAGVRTLERTIGKLLRKVATRVAAEEAECPVVVDTDDVPTWLGRARFLPEANERTSVPGVATGLAVTGAGGDVLFVEATSYLRGAGDATAGLTVTGQLGDVMRESAEIALSFVRSRAVELGIDTTDLDRRFHVHFPAGAVPKDGPSAGVTMTTALVSLLTRRPVRNNVGMTGEVTLQGRVLPIGGVKQKVLAAHRAGLTEV